MQYDNITGEMNRKAVLLMIFGALALARLLLTPKGHFFLQDELRYRYTFAFIREMSQGDLVEAGRQLFQFNLYARPLLVIFNLPSALLQVILLLATGIKTETPLSLTIPSVFQIAASLGIAWQSYRLIKRFTGSFLLATAGIVIHGVLINTNLYLRHILPYDTTLLVYLWLTNRLLEQKETYWWLMPAVTGVIITAMHLIYPNYYLFGMVVGILATFLPRDRWLLRGSVIGSAFMIVLVAIQTLGGFLGSSLLQSSQFLVSRVVVGSPKETLVFAYKYSWEVEGLIGKILVISFSGFLVHFLWKWDKYTYKFRLLAVAMVGTYLLHGFSGWWGKVYYGRTMHMFFWFVVLGILVWLQTIFKYKKVKYFIVSGLLLVSLVSFAKWYPVYLDLQYPGDTLYNYCQFDCPNQVSIMNENYAPDDKENQPVMAPRYMAVNFGRYFFPTQKVYDYDLGNQQLLWQAPHPINFVGYQFDALTPSERQLIRERNYQMKLYKLP